MRKLYIKEVIFGGLATFLMIAGIILGIIGHFANNYTSYVGIALLIIGAFTFFSFVDEDF